MRHYLLVTLFLASVLLVSMAERSQVPPELRNLKALVKDSKGVSHELTSLRCGDGASLKLKKGNLDYYVSLSSIKSIEVLGQDGEAVRVKLSLRDGSSETLHISSSTRCTAQSKLGTVSFYINEVRSVKLIKGRE